MRARMRDALGILEVTGFEWPDSVLDSTSATELGFEMLGFRVGGSQSLVAEAQN